MFELFILAKESETTIWEKMISNMWNIIYVKLYSVGGDNKVKNYTEELQEVDSGDLSRL